MLAFVSAFALSQAARSGSVSDELAAAQAIAAYELAWWRRNHPKADLDVTFSNPQVTPQLAGLVRARLGYRGRVNLDEHVLTIVYDTTLKSAGKRLTTEAYVFLGSAPKGFYNRYLIRTDGKAPVVVIRTVLRRYELEPPPQSPPTIT